MMLLFVLSVACAVTEWIAIAARRRYWEYGAKPATLLVLILWFLSELPRPWPALGCLFAVGLACSLLGDVLLILPRERFVAGLVAFLAAHLAYIVAFNSLGTAWTTTTAAIAVALLVLTAAFLRHLRPALLAKGRGGLLPALAVYSLILGLMLWSAWSLPQNPAWSNQASVMIAVGGLLFYLSDLGLAQNKFVRPTPGGRVVTMAAYHLAQFALSWGVLLQLGAF